MVFPFEMLYLHMCENQMGIVQRIEHRLQYLVSITFYGKQYTRKVMET